MLTVNQVDRHIRTEGAVKWVPMGSLLKDTPEACVDGRADHGIVGTPGGNAGLFVAALTAVEQVTGKDLELPAIERMLVRWIAACGTFYMHTDMHAVEHLEISLNDMFRPKPWNQEKLLEQLIDPTHIGCGHLRLMVQHPEQYEVRQELVTASMQAVYRILWKGTHFGVEFVILEGDHKEGAVVNVLLDHDDITADTMIPTLKPMVDGEQMFINHPQATDFMLIDTARHISTIVGIDVDQQAWLKAVRTLVEKQLVNTVGYLAPQYPVYNAVFGRDQHLLRVEEVS